MSEKDNINSILGNYQDRERLTTIGRLYKVGHITEDEFVNLLTGDRNYFLTNTIEEIRKTLVASQTPWQYPTWIPSVITTSGYAASSPTVTYSTGLSN